MTNITESDPEKNSVPELFRKSIQNLSCKEFDGHTNFGLLTPDDKLHWLSEMAKFFFDNQKGSKSQ